MCFTRAHTDMEDRTVVDMWLNHVGVLPMRLGRGINSGTDLMPQATNWIWIELAGPKGITPADTAGHIHLKAMQTSLCAFPTKATAMRAVVISDDDFPWVAWNNTRDAHETPSEKSQGIRVASSLF